MLHPVDPPNLNRGLKSVEHLGIGEAGVLVLMYMELRWSARGED